MYSPALTPTTIEMNNNEKLKGEWRGRHTATDDITLSRDPIDNTRSRSRSHSRSTRNIEINAQSCRN